MVGGAIITHIDPACTFLRQVEVGDQIITINWERVTCLQDVIMGKEKLRKFGVLKKSFTSAATTDTAVNAVG